ncbi:MAG: ShlB/FhaC/HecB family hemolysin secretion/activation protein, partial [Candidatus Omnitrophica bacterium]|nr:ShlB/FhaC/HecB family hemolysin secretion/activation protein [Candidatus Omnitrophota bacterium]
MSKQNPLLFCFYFLIFLSFVVSPTLFAADEPPKSSEASVQEEKILEEARAKLLETERKKPEIEERAEESKPSPPEVSFFVHQIILQGNEIISTDELRSLIASYEDRELTLPEAQELSHRIEQEYRRRGYVTTIVYVPPQQVQNQQLTIEVLEGKTGRLFIEGNRWFSEKATRRYWHIEEGQPFRYSSLAKNLRLMNENPDRTVRAILRPGTQRGYTDIHLKIEDHFPGHGGFSFDNQGIRATGKRRFGFTARYNNALFPDSQVIGGFLFGSDFGAVFSQYLVPITSYGTKFIFGFSHSQAAPKKEFEVSDIHGTSTTYSSQIRQLLFDLEHWASYASIGYDFKDSRSRDTSGTRRRDRLRVLRSGIDFFEYDFLGATALTNQASFGTKLFGATGENNSLAGRAGAEPDFMKYEGILTRSLKLPFDTRSVLKFSSQYTPH